MELNSGYKRAWQKVRLDNGKMVDVMFYIYNREFNDSYMTIVESGDWVKYKALDKKREQEEGG